MTDWNKILQFLEPKMPLYCPEEPSLTQKVFLRTYCMEALFGGAAGGGKALYYKTQIPTINGFANICDVHPGDFILGSDGQPHVVLAESEIMEKSGYVLTFDDGSTVEACDEHLWLTFDASELAALTKRTDEYRAKRRAKRPSRATNSQGEYKSLAIAERNATHRPETLDAPTGTVRTTAEIVATLLTSRGRRNHAVPVAGSLNLPPKDLLIDPYTMGAWLGDGSSTTGYICGQDNQVFENIELSYSIKSFKYTIPNNPNFRVVYFDKLRQDLKQLGLLDNKHIPHDYLWSSEEQRLALLQGLMDTDGTVAKNSGAAEFCNTNKAIVNGVAFLVRSLGMKATVREGRAKLNGKDCGPKWTIKFVANRPVFRLGRKLALQKISSRRTTQFRYIVKAERIGPLPMKCIRVSSPDSLYLVSENFIPTHNSSALLMSALQYVDIPNYSAIIFRRTYADLALPGAIMDRFINWISGYDDVRWNANNYIATFPSGARISFGYLNNSQDFLRYKGSEFQFIGMDEVTEIRESDY